MREPDSIADPAIHLPAIDGLRGIAILMVLAVHTSQRVGNVSLEMFQFPLVGEFVNAGARGVELFFLLSAFTLFRSSRAKYAQEDSPRRNFYIRRAFRILPLWWLMVTLYGVMGSRGFTDMLPSYLLYFGWIRFMPGVDIFPLGWTIFVEETFYLFLPILFAFITTFGRTLVFFAVLLEVAVLWRHNAVLLGATTTNAFIELFPLNHWYCFALGILLYHLYTHNYVRRNILENRRVSYVMDLLAVCTLLMTLTGSRTSASYGLALFSFAALSPHSLLGTICRSAVLRYFGICCFSIYLLHFLLLDVSAGLKDQLLHGAGVGNGPVETAFLIWFPVIACASLALGLLSFYGLEKPCVELGKRIIRKLEAEKKCVASPALEISR